MRRRSGATIRAVWLLNMCVSGQSNAAVSKTLPDPWLIMTHHLAYLAWALWQRTRIACYWSLGPVTRFVTWKGL